MIKHTPMVPQSLRRAGAASALLLTMAAIGLSSGCGGGSSQSVISTGFPQGAGPFSLTTPGSSAGGTMTLTAGNVPSAVFFPAPNAVVDAQAPGCASDSCTSSTGGALALIPGTVYHLQNPNSPKGASFPNPTTLQITYPSAASHDLNTLSIYYYYDNKGSTANPSGWYPVLPSSGGFLSQTGQIKTTLTTVQGTGLYAVMSSTPPPNPGS